MINDPFFLESIELYKVTLVSKLVLKPITELHMLVSATVQGQMQKSTSRKNVMINYGFVTIKRA